MPNTPAHHETAPAKINLTLAVTGRRKDGYHMLDSAVIFAAIGDRISLKPGDIDQLEITGDFAEDLADAPRAENSVWQSLTAFRGATGWNQAFEITLRKDLPVAAGIGGGSSDAAAMLRLLNRLAPTPLAPAALADMALGLGADVPVCLKAVEGGMWRMRGIGELIEPLPAITNLGIVLVNNGTKVATRDVFAAFGAIDDGSCDAPQKLYSTPHPFPGSANLSALGAWITGGNDLLLPAITVAPGIAKSLDDLTAMKSCPGFIASGMSGSGATCFALFTDADAAISALKSSEKIPGWCWAGGVCGIST
ncbi:4-(cytidine 5'-diphospho)-2-C-methyl-D-erythritol kinase [Alphaproteobacteria bacterium LSUCC0684]